MELIPTHYLVWKDKFRAEVENCSTMELEVKASGIRAILAKDPSFNNKTEYLRCCLDVLTALFNERGIK